MQHRNNMTAGSVISGVLSRALIARRSARSISSTISDDQLFPGAQGTCDTCGSIVEWRELYPRDAEGCNITSWRPARFWGDCECWGRAIERSAELSRAGVVLNAGRLVEQPAVDIRSIQRFTLDSFDTAAIEDGAKLLRAAQRWMTSIEGRPEGDYRAGPPVCLYFYSSGKGRGKTHLAAALAMEAFRAGRLISFADEIGFIDRYWAAHLEARDSLTALPGRSAWLTVLDDLGARENTPPSLRDAWYAIFNQRWLKRGWTVITSNHTPAELLDKGTIDDRTYSRLIEMTGGRMVTFEGQDYRLRAARAGAPAELVA